MEYPVSLQFIPLSLGPRPALSIIILKVLDRITLTILVVTQPMTYRHRTARALPFTAHTESMIYIKSKICHILSSGSWFLGVRFYNQNCCKVTVQVHHESRNDTDVSVQVSPSVIKSEGVREFRASNKTSEKD
jgi:hypothetical protein